MNEEQTSVLEQLRAAFPRVEIRASDAFVPWGTTYPDAEAYERQLRGKTWEQLDRSYLARRADALGFLGTSALAAVLPAYLQMLLEPSVEVPDLLLLILTAPDAGTDDGLGRERFDELVNALSAAQHAAVAAVLARFAADHPDTASTQAARRALDTQWNTYLNR